MTELSELAEDLGTSERTLRRLVELGTIRARRPSPRTISIDVGERVYLRTHWTILRALRAALRNEHNVRLALLFGSVARGSAHDRSDVDVAVILRSGSPTARLDLQRRLSNRLDRPVQVVNFDAVEVQPELARQLRRDGRALVDRDDLATSALNLRSRS